MTHEENPLLSAYLDGELASEERAELEAHVSACASCRRELDGLLHMKKVLASAPRRAVPPELIAELEARISRPAWRGAALRLLRPQVWVPAGVMAAATLLIGLWLGRGAAEADRTVPIEPLLAAHARYAAETLVPQGTLVASNYSANLSADSGDTPDQELE